jgi:hypothetical protein
MQAKSTPQLALQSLLGKRTNRSLFGLKYDSERSGTKQGSGADEVYTVLKGLERHKCNVNTKNFYLNFVNSPHLDGLGTILQIPTACTGCTGTDTKNSSTTRYQCDRLRYGTTQRPCTVLCRTLRTLEMLKADGRATLS